MAKKLQESDAVLFEIRLIVITESMAKLRRGAKILTVTSSIAECKSRSSPRHQPTTFRNPAFQDDRIHVKRMQVGPLQSPSMLCNDEERAELQKRFDSTTFLA